MGRVNPVGDIMGSLPRRRDWRQGRVDLAEDEILHESGGFDYSDGAGCIVQCLNRYGQTAGRASVDRALAAVAIHAVPASYHKKTSNPAGYKE